MKRTIVIFVLCILGINAYAQNQELSLDPKDLGSVIEKNDKIINFLKKQIANKKAQIENLGLNKSKNKPEDKSQKKPENPQKKSFRDAVEDIDDLDSLYTAWPTIENDYKNEVDDKDKHIFAAYKKVWQMMQSLHEDYDKTTNDKWLAVNVDDIKPNMLEKHRQQLEDLCLLIGDFEYIYTEEFKVVLDKVNNAKDKETLTKIETSNEYLDILRIPVLEGKIKEAITKKRKKIQDITNGWYISDDKPKIVKN